MPQMTPVETRKFPFRSPVFKTGLYTSLRCLFAPPSGVLSVMAILRQPSFVGRPNYSALIDLPQTRPLIRFRSLLDVNALNAPVLVVNPNVRPAPNWTAMERSIMKTWCVVEHVVRENNTAHRERLSCWA